MGLVAANSSSLLPPPQMAFATAFSSATAFLRACESLSRVLEESQRTFQVAHAEVVVAAPRKWVPTLALDSKMPLICMARSCALAAAAV